MSTNDIDDEDVVFEGTPLHEHLKKIGMSEESEARKVESPKAVLKRKCAKLKKKSSSQNDSVLLEISGQTIAWPPNCSEILEIEIAKKIVESELLVQEDQDFISNFILTEEAFAVYEKKIEEKTLAKNSSSSIFGDVLLFSGSIAAVAGTILYLSERTRLATTVAAVLPTALAAFSTVRSRSSKSNTDDDCSDESKEQFLKLVDLLLSDMKLFKQMVRKSLNLIQGMELMNAGYLFAINKSTGAVSSSNDTKLVTQHQRNVAFPALRLATYKCTIQLLQSYREALSQLLEASPLADYVDMKDHYIAFVDLECFGIEDASTLQDGESVSIRALKDAVQLALVQQSEYLRRFSLVFCEKVREDNDLSKTGVLKQIREMATTLKIINSKLSRVFEYHEAMGLNPEQKSMSLKKKQLQFNFVPLRSLYTSLFSSGLHLQNSLLKIREMEKLFDLLEKQKKGSRDQINSLITSDGQLIEWLKGFQDVQTELNAVVGCLEEGVSQINVLKGDDDEAENKSEQQVESPEADFRETGNEPTQQKVISLNDSTETDNENFDEVFEAFVAEERRNGFEDDCNNLESVSMMSRHASKVLMKELKQVLVGKAEEHRAREERAIERKQMKGLIFDNGHISVTTHDGDSPIPVVETQEGGEEASLTNGITQEHTDHEIDVVDHSAVETQSAAGLNENFASKIEAETLKTVDDAISRSHQVPDFKNDEVSLNPVTDALATSFGVKLKATGDKADDVSVSCDFDGDGQSFKLNNHSKDFEVTSNPSSDPFCQLGATPNHGKNCFEDDFILAKPSSKYSSVDSEEVRSTDSSESDDESDDGGSTSSSHPSTIRSVGDRAKDLLSESLTIGDSSGYSDSSDEDELRSCEVQVPTKISKQKLFKKRKCHHLHDLDHSLPQRTRDEREAAANLGLETSSSRISVSEIRSFSTPDLKQLVAVHSSPYVSLEDISPKKNPSQFSRTDRHSSSSSESSDWGSMDELENFTLKTFRRPLRPAAQKKATFKSRRSENSSTETEKVHKNGEKVSKNGPENGHSEQQNGINEEKMPKISVNEQTAESSSHASVYRLKHREQINEIRQPSGFDALLASQVVARAQNFGKRFNFLQKEEVFGSE